MSDLVVVAADAGGPAELVRALTQVCGSVPEDVTVVAVSARFPHLPTHLSSRVEQVRVRHDDDVALAVDDIVTSEAPGSVVVAVAARAQLRSGWFESAREHAGHVPHQIGVFGAAPTGASRLLRVLPSGTSPSRLTSYPLPHVVGVSEQPARVLPSPRAADLPVASLVG